MVFRVWIRHTLASTMSPRFCIVADSPFVTDQVFEVIHRDLFTLHPLEPAATWERDGGAAAVRLHADQAEADAVLVEWDLLKAAAFGSVCARLRSCSGPVVALVPSGASTTTALAIGADTTHPLPPSLELLHAQVLAHRRVCASNGVDRAAPPSTESALFVGPLSLDLAGGTLSVGSETVELASRQAGVLACFLRNPGLTLSRERLLADAWGWDFDPGTNVVDVYVHYLRQVLGRFGLRGAIETVRGRGYRLSAGLRQGPRVPPTDVLGNPTSNGALTTP